MVPYPRINLLTISLDYSIQSKFNGKKIIEMLYDDNNSLGFMNSANG